MITRLLPVALLAACWTGSGPGPADHSAPAAPPATVATSGCTVHDRTFGFAVTGHGLGAYEGRRVWAVALENGPHRRTVKLEGTIVGGRFALRCPRSLERNNDYPAWVVVIDADNDGTCSARDVQRGEQYYGWSFDITANLDGAGWQSVQQAHTVVGDHDSFSLCERYF